MSYCPSCKYQFEKDLKICPNCETELIEHLPEEHEVDEKWILLKKYHSEVEANMIKEVMENNDISCLIRFDVLHDSLLVDSSTTLLFVSESTIEKAKKILSEMISVQKQDSKK